MEQPVPIRLTATLEEVNFWLRIMGDHAKFIRGALDLSENIYIQTANNYAAIFDMLLNRAAMVDPNHPVYAEQIIHESIFYVTSFRNFKLHLYDLVSDCKVISKIPAGVYNHVKEEANYFLTLLCRYAGCRILARSELGIEDHDSPNAIVARMLIPYNKEHILEIAHDINIFWLDKHKEHSDVLLLIAFRPHIQDEFWNMTQEFEKKITALYNEFKNIPLHKENIIAIQQRILPVMRNWRDYLEGLYKRVFACDIASKGINTDGSLLNHMAREAQYYIEAMEKINQTLD